MNKKGQAAMEFLMTYGWAILVVLVAIGALAYFGVLSPDRFLPKKCIISPGIACVEHKVTQSSVTLVLRNGMGQDMNGTLIKIPGCDENLDDVYGPFTFYNGQEVQVVVDCDTPSPITTSRFDGIVNVTYGLGTPLLHNDVGQLVTRVEQ